MPNVSGPALTEQAPLNRGLTLIVVTIGTKALGFFSPCCTCFKTVMIIPVLKKSAVPCLNDYLPVALTTIPMKCFGKLVLHQRLTSQLAWTLTRLHQTDPQKISTALHTVFTHFENNNTYIRMLFVEFRSAFNISSCLKMSTTL